MHRHFALLCECAEVVAELIGCTQRETIVVLAAVHIAVVAILAFLYRNSYR